MNQSPVPTRVINVAKEFSLVPAGRFYSDGPNSGERFRETVLFPALQRARSVEIVLDGAEGFGSSFLEEAFGGLVRNKGMTPDDVLARVKIVSIEDPSLVGEIEGYVRAAKAAKR